MKGHRLQLDSYYYDYTSTSFTYATRWSAYCVHKRHPDNVLIWIGKYVVDTKWIRCIVTFDYYNKEELFVNFEEITITKEYFGSWNKEEERYMNAQAILATTPYAIDY